MPGQGNTVRRAVALACGCLLASLCLAASASAYDEGSFVHTPSDQRIYRVVGGAPLYVSDWNHVGGPQPYTDISDSDLAAMNPVPRDGTLVGASGGGVFVIVGGAPIYVSSWDAIGGPQSTIGIDQWDVDNAGIDAHAHLRPLPADGAFVNTSAGYVYRIAGGAPIKVGHWSAFGGVKPSTRIDQWSVDNAENPLAHLRTLPVDGTPVEGLPSHSFWGFYGGRRYHIAANARATQVDDEGLAAFAPYIVPNPKFAIAFRPAPHRRGRVTSLSVFGAWPGSTLTLSCAKHCAPRKYSKTAVASANADSTLIKARRKLRVGRRSRLRLTVAHAAWYGRSIAFKVNMTNGRVTRMPKSTGCVFPDSGTRVGCP